MRQSISNFFVSTLCIVVGISFIFNACKKDIIVEDPIGSAKDWYLKNNISNSVLLQSSKGTSQQVKEEVDWNTARTFQLDDGTNIVGVPVKMILGKIALGGSYMLLIDKIKNTYRVRVAYNAQKDYFKKDASDEEMIAIYNQTLTVLYEKAFYFFVFIFAFVAL